MHLDLRYPIGLLLGTYGAILAVDGAVEHATVLGVNVNLWWGGAMLVCGGAALAFARAGSNAARERRRDPPPDGQPCDVEDSHGPPSGDLV